MEEIGTEKRTTVLFTSNLRTNTNKNGAKNLKIKENI